MKGTVVIVTEARPMAHPAKVGDTIDTDDLLRAGYEVALDAGMIYAKHSRTNWDWVHAEVTT